MFCTMDCMYLGRPSESYCHQCLNTTPLFSIWHVGDRGVCVCVCASFSVSRLSFVDPKVPCDKKRSKMLRDEAGIEGSILSDS